MTTPTSYVNYSDIALAQIMINVYDNYLSHIQPSTTALNMV